MKQLNFVRGGGYRKVIVKGREISFILPELNNVPLVINLDELDKHKSDLSKMKIDKKTLSELLKLKTEEDLVRDITKDLKKSGWRLYKKI